MKRLTVAVALVAALFLLPGRSAAPVAGQGSGAQPYTPDANTVILDHLDGSSAGNVVGGVTWEPSLDGLDQAAVLVTGSYIRHPQISGTSMPEGTWEAWVKPAQCSSAEIIEANTRSTPSGGTSGHFAGLALNSDCKLIQWKWNWDGLCPTNLVSNSVLPLHQWTHVAASWDADGTKIYINGQLDASSSHQCGATWDCCSFYIYFNGRHISYAGSIDEVRVSDVARTTFETVPPPAVGGLAELPDVSGSSAPNYLALAALAAAALAALAAGTWYARRRLS